MKISITILFAAGTLFFAGRCISIHAQDTNVNYNGRLTVEMIAAIDAKFNKPVTTDEIIASIQQNKYGFDESLATRSFNQSGNLSKHFSFFLEMAGLQTIKDVLRHTI
jgi:hypothetical protein